MADIILVTGGTRSGKSDYALRRGEVCAGSHCFIATCKATDPEMIRRVEKHQQTRSAAIWHTIEEDLYPGRPISAADYDVYLVDCLTLWISNLMAHCAEQGRTCGEDYLAAQIAGLLDAVRQIAGTVIFVTSEVGLGVVPENDIARHYRDLVGMCNQLIAAQAQEVILVSCGLPLYVKQK
ncbi:MAG: bifunctional adenosylcobinamide kinase/adenosylcobinamide-phosphate guanylyltransferase [Desulfocapsaceae bacterium]